MGIRNCSAISACLILLAFSAYAQSDTSVVDSVLADAPRVFVDCPDDDCYDDYLKTEITFVNFVRDRALANIHILVADEDNAAGGDNVKVEFIGKAGFEGMHDTLQFFTQPSDTDDKTRLQLAKTIRLGLMQFVARTPIAKDITIAFDRPTKPAEVKDRWNYWVFEVSLNGWFQGQKSFKEWSMWTNWEARRVTEKNRLELSFWAEHSEEVYRYESMWLDPADSAYKLKSLRAVKALQSEGADAEHIWGLDDHWSSGGGIGFSTSEYSNLDGQTYVYGALEYNIVPNKESTRRLAQLRVLLLEVYADYIDETIFGKHNQWLTKGKLITNIEFTQPWGSTGIYAEATDYFQDLDLYRLSIHGQVSLRLFAGLEMNLNGSAAKIHDQVALAKGSASDEDVLLQRRQLATSYQYNLSVGFSYTFGSVYTNIVNPRFGG